MYDLLFKSGLLIDGSGAPAFRADIALQEGRIAAIGDQATARPIRPWTQAAAIYVGLVDIHTHSDLTLALDEAL